MGKSVNEYYAEKMKKLLEMQNEEKHPAIAAPEKTGKNQTSPQEHRTKAPDNAGRNYYDSFRRGSASEPKIKSVPNGKNGIPKNKTGYVPPKITSDKNGNGTGKNGKGNGKINPEQTGEDKLREEERRIDADLRARKGRKLRKIRDTAISVFLVLAVATLMCVAVYRLLFVVSNVNVNGAKYYSPDEIIKASGIKEGEHLYSFRNSVAENLIVLRCPAVGTAEVDKVAPSTVNLNITEEKILYYADFYGELRQMSESLKILYAVTPEEAAADGLIRLYLPSVSEALSGKKAVYSGVRSDAYIYELTSDVMESALGADVRSIDMRNKYDLEINYNNRFLIKLGDSESIKTKLKLAYEIVCDNMFEGNNDKAKVNVSDLSASSVIIDNKLVLN